MRTISVAVSDSDYEAFRRAAGREGRPIAQLIREAMAAYRAERLGDRGCLVELPLLAGHRLKEELPSRDELYNDVYGASESGDEARDAPHGHNVPYEGPADLPNRGRDS